jgi:hypothetical protein
VYQTLKENVHDASQHPVSTYAPLSAPIASDGAGPSTQTSEDPTTAMSNHDSTPAQTIVIPSAEEVQKHERTLSEVSTSADRLSMIMCRFFT